MLHTEGVKVMYIKFINIINNLKFLKKFFDIINCLKSLEKFYSNKETIRKLLGVFQQTTR